MKTSDFYYDLPPELIASEPLAQRSASRLMCLNKAGEITHKHFTDLPDLLRPGDLLVFNNSKVIPARLYAFKPTGGKVEILIERILDDHTALAHVKGAKSLREGATLFLMMSSRAQPRDLTSQDHSFIQGDPSTPAAVNAASGRDDSRISVGPRHNDLLELKTSENWHDLLDQYGHIPLPPYMEREDREEDRNRYQTVYADEAKKGSVAAPTAGLHFDDDLLRRLKDKGINSAYVTLHVGAGTFQPVRVADVADHKMHHERYEITQEVIDIIGKTKSSGGRVIAVGTTSVRVLESTFSASSSPPCADDGIVTGETDIFITPGYQFKVIDGLITNFHLSESTLLMLVSALMGRDNILSAYKIAVEEKYRFFSYGDAMLLE